MSNNWLKFYNIFPRGEYLNGHWRLIWTLAGSSLLLLAVLAAHKASQPSNGPQMTSDQVERIAAQQASVRALEASRLKIEEEILRTDLNPGWVSNPGDLQKALLSEGARIRTTMYELQNNRKNPITYREDITLIRLRARIEALKWINMATRGERAIVVYIDPATGKKVNQELSSHTLQAMGLIRLVALNYSERDARQEYPLDMIAHDTLASQAEHKRAWEYYLNANNFGPVAVRHSNLDLFGREMIPNTEDVVKVPEPKQVPSPAPPAPNPPTATPRYVPAPKTPNIPPPPPRPKPPAPVPQL